ncbi:unnamed protein product [Bursaphelenchus xylophilus]|uniref:(pine wood nematode) hypothetical protein n=1 Tax=Bursaphelenchus xylophilus TaxID=6326 RepID=A0A1I7SCB2_BURXY|nr:unnamed protein product [Bursaphelenchus xylophilus]CAG9094429.1 unnamed protein product [Bursaphelenchus xylophilus]
MDGQQLMSMVKMISRRLALNGTFFCCQWRHSGLRAINKLHLLEAHLADFVASHGSWRPVLLQVPLNLNFDLCSHRLQEYPRFDYLS